MTAPDLAALRALAEKATPDRWHVGAQNDALFIVAGRAPAPSNDHPWHDAPRVAVAKMLGPQDGDCLPVDAEANAAYIAAAHPQAVLTLITAAERVPALEEEVGLLREALFNACVAIRFWGSYASPYFQEKYDIQGDVDAITAALGEPRA